MNRFTRRRALVLLVLTGALFITVDQRDSGAISGARSAFSYVFRPFKGAARAVTRPVRNAWRGMTNYGDLEKENLALRDQLAQQAGNSAAAEAFVREHNDLLTLSQLPTGPNIATVTAQVIGGTPREDQQTVEINQGTNRGLRIGMPVVNGAGLIGKVTEVFPTSALVRLLTDPQYVLAVKIACTDEIPGTVGPTVNTTPTGISVGSEDPRFTTTTSTTTTTVVPGDSSVPRPSSTTTRTTTTQSRDTSVEGESTDTTIDPADVVATTAAGTTTTIAPCDRETGSIRGQGKGLKPIVGLLEDDVRTRAISIGDRVVSAGGAESLAPPNLPIGKVSRVIEHKGSSPEIEVELNADLNRLNFVSVLLYLPASEVTP